MPSALPGLARVWDPVTASESQRSIADRLEGPWQQVAPALRRYAGADDLFVAPAMSMRLEASATLDSEIDASVMPVAGSKSLDLARQAEVGGQGRVGEGRDLCDLLAGERQRHHAPRARVEVAAECRLAVGARRAQL